MPPRTPRVRPGTVDRLRRRRLTLIALVLMVALAPIEYSYGRSLGAPGTDSFLTRSVEWVRDHGGGPVVNVGENWYYALNRPTGAAPDPESLPRARHASDPGPAPGPPALPVTAAAPLPEEGVWTATSRTSGGAAPVYRAWFRPDPALPSVVAGVVWMNQALASTTLVAGTNEPVPYDSTEPRADSAGGRVPSALVDTLLATFNSGFKIKDANGGYYSDGREVRPLREGAASLAIDRSGRVSIGAWGRDVRLTPDTTAVRQNLALVVEAGSPVAGLDANPTGAWGSSRHQLQYTWRSGVGVDRGGNLVYVAADQVTLAGLAHAMAVAGIVTGMQLDIHGNSVGCLLYRSTKAARSGRGSLLLPLMKARTYRYVRPDRRDFFAVTSRPAVAGP